MTLFEHFRRRFTWHAFDTQKGTDSMYRMFNAAMANAVVALVLLAGAPAIAGPKLICEQPTYQFGEREQGESVEHTFTIKNVGDEPADLTKLKPQCGCAVLGVTQDLLAPGETTTVTLKVSLGNQLGPFRKSLVIASEDNQQDRLVLAIKGAVTSILYVMPERLELGHVDADQEVSRTVVVAFAQEQDVTVTRCVADVNTVVPEVKTLKKGGLYRVTVRVKPIQGTSRIQAKVLLYTDSDKHPMVSIPVTGDVGGDLVAVPDNLVLAGKPGVSATRYIVVRSPGGLPFEIEEVQCPAESVKAEVKSMGDAGYRLELSGLSASPELDGKHVVVRTSLSSVPAIQIPLHVRSPAVVTELPLPAKEQPPSQAEVPPAAKEQTPTRAELPLPAKEQIPAQMELALPTPPKEKPAAGAFVLEEQNVDRGKVPMGKPVEHTFRLWNTSKQTRRILSVKPGCSCAEVVDFTQEVASQSYGKVTVALDTIGNPGLRQSSVLITTNDPDVPRFNPLLSCHVLPAIQATPHQMRIAAEGTSGFPSKTLEIEGTNHQERISLGDIQSSDPLISVTQETIEEHRRFRLNLAVSKDMPAGITLAHLVIPVKGSAQKSVWFPMTIANQVTMKAEPSGLELYLDKDALQTAEFVVTTLDNSPLEVTEVELAGATLPADVQQTEDNAARVRLEALKVTNALDLKHVRVFTNHGELRVPISVRVRPKKAMSASHTSSIQTGGAGGD